MRRKGELSSAGIDRGWPYQVALLARFCENCGYKEIHDFCVGLSLCTRATQFTTANGSTCIALQKLTTPQNSKSASAA
jgi:hypothetical protein